MTLLSKKIVGGNILCEYSSSNLKNSDYNITDKTLTVTFGNGSKYRYFDVPHDTVAKLNLAESTGSFFSKNIIKGGFKYEKLIN